MTADACWPRCATCIGKEQYHEVGEFPVERGYVWTSCASVENGNPLYWDDEVAGALTGGPVAPPSMVSVWFRPHHWAPGRTEEALPLQVHFDLKERFGLPEAVMTDNTIEFHTPVRMGDVLRTHQVLRSVSDEKTTKLGTGRFWVIDVVYSNQDGELVAVESYTGFGYRRGGGVVTHRSVQPRLLFGDVAVGDELPALDYEVTATTVVLGALATRDWRPMHHDKDFAVHRNGTQDIFLNTPNQAAWFERYLTDWTGPHGRLARVTFRMKGSVFPGDTMSLRGVVESTEVDARRLRVRVRGGDPVGRRGRQDDLRRPPRAAPERRRQPVGSPGRPVATVAVARSS